MPLQLPMSQGAAPGRASPCQALPAPSSEGHPPSCLAVPTLCPHTVSAPFPASRTPLSPHLVGALVLCHHGVTPHCQRGGDHAGAPPQPRSSAPGSGTPGTCGGAPCQPVPTLAEGTHQGLSLLTCRWRGWSPRWDECWVWGLWWHREMAAARATSGRSGHTGPGPAPCAGAAGGGRQGETEAGGAAWGGGNAISMVGVLPPWGVLSAASYLLRGAQLGGISCCLWCSFSSSSSAAAFSVCDTKELGVTGLWPRSPPPPPSWGPPDLSSR